MSKPTREKMVNKLDEWMKDIERIHKLNEESKVLEALEKPKVATKGICKWHGEIKPEVEIVHLCPECLESCFVTEFGTEVEG